MTRLRSSPLTWWVRGLLTAGLLAATFALPAVHPAEAAGVFTVTTNGDSGPGSLREAITLANADASAAVGSPHAITFNLPVGSTTINVVSALPAITRPTVIDGLTQPGASCGAGGTPRNLIIHIRGAGNGVSMSGVRFVGGGSTLQGVAVSYFRAGNVISTGATGGDIIRCNHIGANPAGTVDTVWSNVGALSGNPVVTASVDISSPSTRLGGTLHTAGVCDGDCNVVLGEGSNNNQIGVLLRFGALTGTLFNGFSNPATSTASGGIMQGNFIGIAGSGQNVATVNKTARNIFIVSTDTPSAAPPAVPHLIPSSGGYLIGGIDVSGQRDVLAGNVISGAKFRDGIDADTGTGSASGVRIYGNLLGIGPDGEASADAGGIVYGNARDGIQLEGLQSADIQANVVSGNGANGINVASISDNTVIRNNVVGLSAASTANGNGWYSTPFVAGNPNFGLGGVTTNNNAGNGNGISVGAFSGSVPNRDVANLVIDANTIGANWRTGISLIGGSGGTTITANKIGVTSTGATVPNRAGGIVAFTDNNVIERNVIAANGGPGISIVRNTVAAIGGTFGGYVPVPTTATNNNITANSIYANIGVGIDLNSVASTWGASGNTILFPFAWTQGVTPNDGALSAAPPANADTFGNRDVDYPVFTAAVVNEASSTITVTGYVGLAGGSSVFAGAIVEVFRGDNIPADQDGPIYTGDPLSVPHPEGRTLLGTCPVSGAGTFVGCVLILPASAPVNTWTTADLVTGTTTLGTATSEFGVFTGSVEIDLLVASVRINNEVCTLGTTVSACDPTAAAGTAGWAETHTFRYLDTPIWRQVITNTGELPLEGVVVTDTLAPGCAADTQPGYQSTLAVGESFTIVCAGAGLTGSVDPYTARVTATARGAEVTDTDTASALLETPVPKLTVVKTVNGDDANTAPGVQVETGSTMTFVYTVTNTGNVPLANVNVVDDMGVNVTCPSDRLAVDAAIECSGTAVAPAGQYTNTGTASAVGPTLFNSDGSVVDGTRVSGSDSANVFGSATTTTVPSTTVPSTTVPSTTVPSTTVPTTPTVPGGGLPATGGNMSPMVALASLLTGGGLLLILARRRRREASVRS